MSLAFIRISATISGWDTAWISPGCSTIRALPDADATGNFQQIDQLERELEARNPALF
jgi:hypothetical protein